MGTGDLLRIQPSELKFPFELKKQSSCCMQLTNKTDQYVAFKVKTTNPKKYCVRPNAGIVLPGSTCDVTVTMQAQKEAPLDMQCKDKFLLQSIVAERGATAKDITPEMFNKEPDKVVEEFKLRVVYIPANPPSPVPEESEEGSTMENGVNSSSVFDAVSRTYEAQSKEKSSEASTLISKLTEDKTSALQQNQKLRQELVHPNTPMFKNKLFEILDGLLMVVGNHSATGRAAGGLGVEGVESATLHNALGEGKLDDDVGLDDMGVEDLTQSPIGTPPPPPNSTTGVDTHMNSSVLPTSNTTRNVRRETARTIVGAWSNSTLQEIATGITVISKALQELVLEVRLLRSRNQPWVEGICTIPGFNDEQRLTVLNENVPQDLKDAFVRMNNDQRRRFMIWRLTGTFPNAIEEDENLLG